MEELIGLLVPAVFIGTFFYVVLRGGSQGGHQITSVSLGGEKKKALPQDLIGLKIPELPKVWVRWVVDGDTVIVTKGRREVTIRLDSIDCPEDGQPWGDKAKFGLIKLIGGQQVHLEEYGMDSYGRTLATIYVWHRGKDKWLNVNERMVILGHAWVMRGFYDHLSSDRQEKLNDVERWARSRNVGLWREENPVPPWEWRHGR